jgi:hypothetical protein
MRKTRSWSIHGEFKHELQENTHHAFCGSSQRPRSKKEGRRLQMKGSFEDEKGEKTTKAEGLWIMMGKNVGREGREVEVMRRNPRSRRGMLDVKIIGSIEIVTNIFDL